MEFGAQHGWFRRLVIGIAATRMGGWLVLNILTRVDPLLMRMTGGRFSMGGLSGVPAVLLTTKGAKSGQPRSVTLITLRDGANLILIASATGIQRHPAWYYNLKKNPQAEAFGQGIAGTYQAREAEGEERARLWARMQREYPAFAVYEARASNRRIPVMVLEPVNSEG